MIDTQTTAVGVSPEELSARVLVAAALASLRQRGTIARGRM